MGITRNKGLMAYWQFKLDTTVVQTPKGWADMVQVIEREKELNAVLIRSNTEFIWIYDGYDYLKDQFDTASVCGTVDVEVEYKCAGSDSYADFFTGTIFVSDIEFNLDTCEAKARISEANFSSLLRNNKKIPFHLDVGRSKSDTSITAPTNRLIDLFNPQTAAYTFNDVESYTVGDALGFLVDALSDGDLQAASTLFDTGGDHEGLMVCKGSAIINAGSTSHAPHISFEGIYGELKTKYNLGIWIDTTTSPPTINVEEEGDVFTGDSGVVIRNITDLKQSLDTNRLYSVVRIGTTTTQADNGVFAFPDITFFSHKEEKFHLLYDCNTDKELNLAGGYVIDSNVIEDLVVNAATTNADDIFLIETDHPSTDDATQYDDFAAAGTPMVYNVGLTNRDIMERWENGIPSSIAQYLGDGNDGFEAVRTATTNHTAPLAAVLVDYDTENSDPNNNFDNTATNYKYTAPSNGFYRFKVTQVIDNFSSTPSGGSVSVFLRIRQFDSGGTPIVTKEGTFIVAATTTLIYEPPGFYMDATDYVQVYIEWGNPAPFIINADRNGGQFESTQVETGGGIYRTFDIEDFRAILYKFEAPLPLADFITLRDDPRKSLKINPGNDSADDIVCWIEQLQYLPESQWVKATVIKSKND